MRSSRAQGLRALGDRAISYAGAVSFAVLEAERCGSAMTFDRDLAIAGFAACAARDGAA